MWPELNENRPNITCFFSPPAFLAVVRHKSTVILAIHSTASSSSSSSSSAVSGRHVITLPYAPLFTGVLWNPASFNVLTLLTKDKCFLFTGIGTDQCKFCLPHGELNGCIADASNDDCIHATYIGFVLCLAVTHPLLIRLYFDVLSLTCFLLL